MFNYFINLLFFANSYTVGHTLYFFSRRYEYPLPPAQEVWIPSLILGCGTLGTLVNDYRWCMNGKEDAISLCYVMGCQPFPPSYL